MRAAFLFVVGLLVESRLPRFIGENLYLCSQLKHIVL